MEVFGIFGVNKAVRPGSFSVLVGRSRLVAVHTRHIALGTDPYSCLHKLGDSVLTLQSSSIEQLTI